MRGCEDDDATKIPSAHPTPSQSCIRDIQMNELDAMRAPAPPQIRDHPRVSKRVIQWRLAHFAHDFLAVAWVAARQT